MQSLIDLINNDRDSLNSSNFINSIIIASQIDNDWNKWNVVEINLFNFIYDEKFNTNDDFLKYADKNIYFRDVHLFVERIQNIVKIKNLKMIRNNLYICLRNTIIKWYINILTKN